MNIVVCLKQVPGTTEVKIDPQTNTLIRQGIENIINPFDTYAIEEGVRLSREASRRLDAAERRIEELLEDGRTTPVAEDAGQD